MKEYERYIIYGLLIALIILVVWSIISKSDVGRYQFWCVPVQTEGLNVGSDVFVLDTATGRLWKRWINNVELGYMVFDLGTNEKPRCALTALSDSSKPDRESYILPKSDAAK